MSILNKKSNIYEYVVVGAGLTGLLVANALSREGAQVLLVDSADFAGGLRRSVQTQVGPTENGLTFLPDTEQARAGLEFVSHLLKTSIDFQSAEREPQTYEHGALRSFVGFGEHSPEFYDELGYYLYPRELVCSSAPSQWVTQLSENFAGELALRSYVTKFHHSEGKIHSLTINGQKNVQALNIIYAGPIKLLKILLPESAWSAKTKQKFSKARFWTSVGLDLIHNHKVSELRNIYVLNGTTQDDLGPCVGRFLEPQKTELGLRQISQWSSFLNDEDAEETENIGHALKKIKRQIKRAYPEALEGLISERIVVTPSSAGGTPIHTTGHQTLPQANNFWIASAGQSHSRNLIASMAQAQLITSALGVNPFGSSIDHVESVHDAIDESEDLAN